MFDLLIDNKSDITKKELMNNETVRDSVFRYCPENSQSFLSMEFIMPQTKSIMQTYREHEAALMIESVTKTCPTKKEKIKKVLLNLRSDLVFIKSAISFFTREYLGKDGPVRVK